MFAKFQFQERYRIPINKKTPVTRLYLPDYGCKDKGYFCSLQDNNHWVILWVIRLFFGLKLSANFLLFFLFQQFFKPNNYSHHLVIRTFRFILHWLKFPFVEW